MFKPGDAISHSVHGVGTVKSYQEREMNGASVVFATLAFHREGFEVTLPKKVLESRARWLMDESQALGIADMLAPRGEPLETDHKKRFRENQERLTSGDPRELCAVVRSLTELRRKRPLANSDNEHLRHCLQRLAEELCAVLGGEQGQTLAQLERASTVRR